MMPADLNVKLYDRLRTETHLKLNSLTRFEVSSWLVAVTLVVTCTFNFISALHIHLRYDFV